jgi:3-phosphoshikimate 1-carboxyvinyltransferase
MYPDKMEVKPLERPPVATVRVPGSKSITNRALVLAALTSHTGECQLSGALQSEDTEVMIASLRQLGFSISVSRRDIGLDVDIRSTNRLVTIPARQADLFVANSGTSMRFLTAMVSLGRGRYRLDGVPRMRERPIEDLLSALHQLGVNARSEFGNGCPPVVVEANGLPGGRVSIRGDVSSQFLSGLLLAAPLARHDVDIELDGSLVSQPYVSMTLDMVQAFGATVESLDGTRFRVPGQQTYSSTTYRIEPDATAASYFFGAAAIMGGYVSVKGLWCGEPHPHGCPVGLQGDVHFANVLCTMGCQKFTGATTGLRGGPLRGIDVDMNAISDTVMTLAAVACFADGPTTIRNVAHIRHKETDRLAALTTELRRVGAGVEEFADGLTITPRPLHGAEIETYNDHRMAMSMALIGLRVPGIVIKNPGCVAKTYPGFWEDLERLRQPA